MFSFKRFVQVLSLSCLAGFCIGVFSLYANLASNRYLYGVGDELMIMFSSACLFLAGMGLLATESRFAAPPAVYADWDDEDSWDDEDEEEEGLENKTIILREFSQTQEAALLWYLRKLKDEQPEIFEEVIAAINVEEGVPNQHMETISILWCENKIEH